MVLNESNRTKSDNKRWEMHLFSVDYISTFTKYFKVSRKKYCLDPENKKKTYNIRFNFFWLYIFKITWYCENSTKKA